MTISQPSPSTWYHERLRGRADVPRALERIMAVLAQAGFPRKDVFAIHLALEEALVNAVVHGNREDPAKEVRFRFTVNGEQLLAEVEDDGPGFDPVQVPDPLAPENLDRPSGRGLHLMRQYMTSVQHNSRGNRLQLCKRRSAA